MKKEEEAARQVPMEKVADVRSSVHRLFFLCAREERKQTKDRGQRSSTALFFNLFFKKKSGASTTDNRGCMLPLRTNVLSIVKILYHLQAILSRTFFILLFALPFILHLMQLLLFSLSLSPSLSPAFAFKPKTQRASRV